MQLITGASGFLGQSLLRELAKLPASVRPELALLVRAGTSTDELVPPELSGRVTFIRGNVAEPQSFVPAARALPLQGIFHLAALIAHDAGQAQAMWQANVVGATAIAELAFAARARLVFVSSSGTVACSRVPNKQPDELAGFATSTAAKWPYYRSKMAAEQSLRALLPRARELVIVRPPMLLGPGDSRYRSTRTLVRFLQGKVPFSLRGTIAVADVRDVAAALVAAMQLPEPRPVYHLPGHDLSLTAYFRLLARLSGRPAPHATLPPALASAVAWASTHASAALPQVLPHPLLDPMSADMAHHHWGIRSLYAAADLTHRPRPLEDTLEETMRDLCARRNDCGSWHPSDRNSRASHA